MALEPADRAPIDQAAADAARARQSAETVAQLVAGLVVKVDHLTNTVAALRQEVEVLRGAGCYVADEDSPVGAVWIVTGFGASKTWVRDGAQMAGLLNRFPLKTEEWSGRELAKIPTVGPEPSVDPPASPTAADALRSRSA